MILILGEGDRLLPKDPHLPMGNAPFGLVQHLGWHLDGTKQKVAVVAQFLQCRYNRLNGANGVDLRVCTHRFCLVPGFKLLKVLGLLI